MSEYKKEWQNSFETGRDSPWGNEENYATHFTDDENIILLVCSFEQPIS